MELIVIPEPREEAPELRSQLHAQKIKFGEAVFIRDSVESAMSLLGEFIFKPEVMTGAMGAIGGWLAAKQHRKVRVKFGDTEAEAHSVEELEAVLELAKKHGDGHE